MALNCVSGFGPHSFSYAQEAATEEEKPKTSQRGYDPQLERLFEVVGSLHFLLQLCQDDKADAWRSNMDNILTAENPTQQRRALLIGRFNQGYDSFSNLYRVCTDQAKIATDKFLAEGKKLNEAMIARYGG